MPLPLALSSALALATPAVPSGHTVEAFATTEIDPQHLAFDAAGDLWVGHDTGTVTELRTDGTRVVVVSGLPDPDSVFIDEDGLLAPCGGQPGDLLVGNFGDLRIHDPSGPLRAVIGGGVNLQGFTVDGFGRLLFADLNNHRIGTLSAACTQQPVAALGAGAYPGDVAADGDVLYVSDTFGSRKLLVLDLDATGAVAATTAVPGFHDPEGVTIDGVGDLGGGVFVAERATSTAGSEISVVDPVTRTRAPFATGFGDLRDVAVGPDGCLYASDVGADVIWRICAVETDADGDGVPDESDVCPTVADPDQVDQDLDGVGDACDPDLDGDGVDNELDGCPDLADPDQADADGDGIGDACDDDADGDSVNDGVDNCLGLANADQADGDGDGAGDACDPDDDDDGVPDADDLCPTVPDPTQADADGDGLGDACDADADGDGVDNADDVCPATPADAAADGDGCSGPQGIERACGTSADHPNHGAYVSCVAHAAQDAVDAGLITAPEKAIFVRNAARSR